jgi:hypothetical protein
MPVAGDAAVVAAAGAPVLAFAGSWLGARGSRRASLELDRWRRREETMRLLRWAAELALERDERRAGVGIAAMDALQGSELLQDEDLDLVETIAQSLVDETEAQFDHDTSTGEADQVAYGGGAESTDDD